MLCTFLAVWFWVSLVMDYGFFKVFGLDWVQEAPRLVRALVLGIFFAGIVALLQFPTLLPALAREFRQGLHEAFAVTPRQYVPYWLRLASSSIIVPARSATVLKCTPASCAEWLGEPLSSPAVSKPTKERHPWEWISDPRDLSAFRVICL